jgi:hypothetical protein
MAWRTSKQGTNSSANTFTVTEPTGIAQGDFEFVLVSVSAASSVSTPAGWTLLNAVGPAAKFFIFYVTGGRGASPPTLTFTGTFSGGSLEWHCLAFTNGSVNIDASATTTLGQRTTPNCPSAVATGSSDEALAIAFNWDGSVSGGWAAPSGYTIRSVNGFALDCVCASKTLSAAGAEDPGAYNASNGGGPNDTWEVTLLIGDASVGGPTLEQEGYRWRNDDGSESAATWKAAQDTVPTITAGNAARLRMDINATNDPVSQDFQLEYRKVGDTTWKKVE